MARYIELDALVAEIKSRIKSLEECFNGKFPMSQSVKETEQDKGKLVAYKSILSFSDSLEVKEVDLEKAIDAYIYTHDGRKRLALELDWKYCNLTLKGGNEIIKFAKHFFELGLKASKDLELTWEDIKNLENLCTQKRVNDGLFDKEDYEEVLKRFKAQKGE